MDTKINFHSHTNFCDGSNSVEEMILGAINAGFSVFGISSHSMYPFSGDCHISVKDHQKYVQAVRDAAKKYENQIKVFLGFEVEYIPSLSIPSKQTFAEFSPDYLIGSVHYLVNEKGWFAVDNTAQDLQEGIAKCFANNGKEAAIAYFEAQRQMLSKGDFEIWGHPDLIRKRNGIVRFFDEKEEWYKDQLKQTVAVAKKAGVIAEINTGAIARKAMDDVYPSKYFLELIHEAGIPVCVNTDTHSTDSIDTAYQRAVGIAKQAGYSELVYPCGVTARI